MLIVKSNTFSFLKRLYSAPGWHHLYSKLFENKWGPLLFTPRLVWFSVLKHWIVTRWNRGDSGANTTWMTRMILLSSQTYDGDNWWLIMGNNSRPVWIMLCKWKTNGEYQIEKGADQQDNKHIKIKFIKRLVQFIINHQQYDLQHAKQLYPLNWYKQHYTTTSHHNHKKISTHLSNTTIHHHYATISANS